MKSFINTYLKKERKEGRDKERKEGRDKERKEGRDKERKMNVFNL
jgi:hypothetical protein